jgi:hypothetical protein
MPTGSRRPEGTQVFAQLLGFPTHERLALSLTSLTVAGALALYGVKVVRHELVIDVARFEESIERTFPTASALQAGLRILTGAEAVLRVRREAAAPRAADAQTRAWWTPKKKHPRVRWYRSLADAEGKHELKASGAFDLGGSHADAVAGLQDLVGANRLTVDADEKVLGLATRQMLLKQWDDGCALGHLDVVGEAGTVVVDEQDVHVSISLVIGVEPMGKVEDHALELPCREWLSDLAG